MRINLQQFRQLGSKALESSGLIARQLFDKESSTYTYLLGCTATRHAVIIDPVLEQANRDAQIIRELRLDLQMALNTHAHADRITGTAPLRQHMPHLKSAIARASGAKADILLDDNQTVDFGQQQLQVLATPGHTSGCVCYYHPKAAMVFTGDTLLIRGCGRTDFQQGSSGQLYQSVISRLFTLPDSTYVYPGHDYQGRLASTVGEEKEHNPRLAKSKEEFTQIMADLNLPYPKKIDAAVPANMVDGEGAQPT